MVVCVRMMLFGGVILCCTIARILALEASFYGESYVWLPREDASSTTELQLEFRTGRPDALLFLAGGAPDYLLVKLEQGGIRVVMDLGSGEAILGSHPGLLFNDLHWHYIHLVRTDRTISLNINNMSTISTNSPGAFTELNINKGLFLGAVAASADLFYGILKEYRGCMKNVFFNGMDVLDAAHLEQDPLHVYEVTWQCSPQFGASSQQPISFLHNTSFVAFRQLDSYKQGRFTFDLRTRSELALLLYGSGRFSNPDFIALELVDGRAHLTVNKGSGEASFSAGGIINDATWHQLEVVINPVSVSLSVDGQREERQMNFGDSRYLDLYGFLYVGGVGIMARSTATQHRLQSLIGLNAAAGSVIGCIQNFKINGELFGFRETEVTKDVLPECLWTFPCTSNPCIAGAECEENGYYYYECQCAQPNCFRPGFTVAGPSPTQATHGIVHVQNLVVQEGGIGLILRNNLDIVTDYSEYGIRDSDVVFRLVSQPEHGTIRMEIEESSVTSASLFTLDDVMENRVSYAHDGSESSMDSIALGLEFMRPEDIEDTDIPNMYKQEYGLTLMIDIIPWNDKPDLKLPRDNTLELVSNTRIHITPRILRALDRDDPPSHLEYTVHYQHGYDIGYFELNNGVNVRARITTFTQEEINEGMIVFIHRGAALQQIRIQVSDRKDVSDPKTLHIKAVPLEISIESNTGLHVPKGSSNLILKQNLSFTTNTPNQDFPVRYEITLPPFDGEIQRQQPSNNQWVVTSTFTQQDVDNSRLRYFHYGGDILDDFFKFKVYVISEGEYAQEYDFDILMVTSGLNITKNKGLHLMGTRDGYITMNDLMTTSSIPYHTPRMIIYSVLSLPEHGHLYKVHQRTEDRIRKKRINTNFTQEDINSGSVFFRLNKALLDPIQDHFDFRIEVPEMESEIAVFNIDYEPIESEIHFINNGLIGVLEGSQKLLTQEDLYMDSTNVFDFTYTIVDAPEVGVMQLVNPKTGVTTNKNVTSFTNSDIADSKVYYKHDDSETTEDEFSFVVTPVVHHSQETHSTIQEISEYSGTFEIKITLRNDNMPKRLIEKPFNVVANRGRFLTLEDIKYMDPDTDFDDNQLQYTFRHISNGEFVHGDNRSVIMSDFTQGDIGRGGVYFHHYGASNDEGSVMVSDGEFSSIGKFVVQVSEPYIRISNNSGLVVMKGENITITNFNISIDSNLDGPEKDFKFVITEPPMHGQIKKNTNERNRFNLADLKKEQVKYVHDNTEFLDDKFKFVVKMDDVQAEGVVKVKILLGGENLPLSVIHNRLTAVQEGGEVMITKQELLYGHPDAGPTDIKYKITKQPQYGMFVLKESEDTSGQKLNRFSQKDINDGRLIYKHTATGQGSDVIKFQVSNGILTLREQEFVVEIISLMIPLKVEGFAIPEGGMKSISSNNIKMKNRYFLKQDLEYIIVDGPKHGRIVFAENREQHVVHFNHNQVLKRQVLYIHDDTDTTSDNFTLFVTVPETVFRSNPQTIEIKILPTNDQPPRLTVNEPLRLWIGSTAAITAQNLKVEDVDTPDEDLMYIIGNPTNGDVSLKENPNQNILNFTQDHINRNVVMFRQRVNTMSQFDFRVSDGESYTDSDVFVIEAMPLVLSLEKLRPLEAYPGILQPITSANLRAVTNDLDNSRPIYYTLQSKPNNGLLVMVLENGTETEVTSFSQDDIQNKRVSYHHMSSMVGWTEDDSFIFEVSTLYADRISHKTFPIEISYDFINENNRDQLIKIMPLVVAEGETVELTKNNLDISKIRRRLSTGGLSGREVNLRITKLPEHGTLKLNKTNVKVRDNIVQQDINKKRVRYIHDDSDTEIDAFHFSLDVEGPSSNDGTTFDTMLPIEILPKNDQPFHLVTDDPKIELVQGFMCNITNASLNTEDPDTPPSGIVYVVHTAPQYGQLVNSNNTDEAITTFTQQDINSNKILYLHYGSRHKDGFYFRVSDGKHKPMSKVFVINVHPLTLEVIVNKHLEIQQGLFSEYLTHETFNITTNGNKNRVMFNITRVPRYGSLLMNNVPVKHFNYQNVINQDVSYLQTDDTKSMDDFELTIYDSHNIVRGKLLRMKVIAAMKKGDIPPKIPAGESLVLTLAMLNASRLASITQSNPVYSVTEGPRLGRIYVNTRKQRRHRQYKRDSDDGPAEVNRFTHEDIIDGVVEYEPEDSTITAPEADGFSFILKAKVAQPAHGSFEVTVLPSKNMRTSPSPGLGGVATPASGGENPKPEEADASAEGGESKTKEPNDHLMIVYIVSAVTVGTIALIIIIKCVKHKKKKKKQKLEAMKEDSKTPLSEPVILTDPDMSYSKHDPMMPSRSLGYEGIPPLHIPIINVTPDSEAGSMGSRGSLSAKTPNKSFTQEYGSIPRHPNIRRDPAEYSTVRREPADYSSMRRDPSDHSSMRRDPNNYSIQRHDPNDHSSMRRDPNDRGTIPRDHPEHSIMRRDPSDHSNTSRPNLHNQPDHSIMRHNSSDHRNNRRNPGDHPTVKFKPTPPPRSTSPSSSSSDVRQGDPSRTVPTCKVTPLADGEEFDDTILPVNLSGKPEVRLDWENMDPELLQHCRTTNPILHENKYWV